MTKPLQIRRLQERGLALLGPSVFLLTWEFASRASLISPVFFPPPTEIVQAARDLLGRGELVGDAAVTTLRLALTATLAAGAGITLGLTMAAVGWIRQGLEGVLAFLYPIPSLLFLPVVSFLIGRGSATIVLTAAVTPFIIMTMATLFGVRQIEPTLIEAGRNYGADRWRFLMRVLLPGALSSIVSGFRVALGLSLIGVVAIEMVTIGTGLGAFMWQRWQTLRVTDMYVGLVGIAILALLTSTWFDLLVDRLMPWRERMA